MALLLVTGGLLGWWSLWSTSRARAGRQTGSSSSSGQCETRSAIICSMQASRGVGHGYGSALTTIQSEGGYIESAIYGSAREGDAAQAGAGGIAVAIERQPNHTGLTGTQALAASRWSERAPHHRRKLLGLAPMGPPARTGLDETRRDETWEQKKRAFTYSSPPSPVPVSSHLSKHHRSIVQLVASSARARSPRPARFTPHTAAVHSPTDSLTSFPPPPHQPLPPVHHRPPGPGRHHRISALPATAGPRYPLFSLLLPHI